MTFQCQQGRTSQRNHIDSKTERDHQQLRLHQYVEIKLFGVYNDFVNKLSSANEDLPVNVTSTMTSLGPVTDAIP